MRATAYILLGLAWLIGLVLIALLVAHLARSVAASSEAQDPGSSAGLIGPGLRGTPHVGEAAVVAVASRNAGVPTPEQARTEALGAMVEGEIGTVRIADPSRGVVPVTIEYGGPRMTLPPTDQEEMP